MKGKPHPFVFRFRAFVSLLMTASFVIMSISGMILFLAPSTRLANLRNWTACALTRDGWIALHLSFSALFLLTAIGHLWLNRRPLFNYLKIKTKAAAGWRWEWLAVILLAGLTTWGSLVPVEPFTSLIRWRQQFYRSPAAKQDAQINGSRSGWITLEAYCNRIGLDTINAIEALENEGISARPTDTLGAIADRGGIHPSSLRRLLDDVQP